MTKRYHVKFESTLAIDAESEKEAREKAASIMDFVVNRHMIAMATLGVGFLWRSVDLVADECALISCKQLTKLP